MFIIDFVDLILMLNSKNHCQDFCQHQKAYLLLCFPLEVLWFPVFCSSVNLFWVDFCVWYNIVIHFHSLYVALLFSQHHYPSSNIYSWVYHCKLLDYMYIGLFLCSLFCSIDPCFCFYANTILFWFLWFCNIICVMPSALLFLLEIVSVIQFFCCTWILKLFFFLYFCENAIWILTELNWNYRLLWVIWTSILTLPVMNVCYHLIYFGLISFINILL